MPYTLHIWVFSGLSDTLMSMAEKRFEVPVSVQKVIEFLIEKELKKKNGRSNGKARR